MSQVKVEQYKKEKQNRKNWKAEQAKKKIRNWIVAVACIIAVVVALYFAIRVDCSAVNTGASVYDDAALASLVGYSGVSLSDVLIQ